MVLLSEKSMVSVSVQSWEQPRARLSALLLARQMVPLMETLWEARLALKSVIPRAMPWECASAVQWAAWWEAPLLKVKATRSVSV